MIIIRFLQRPLSVLARRFRLAGHGSIGVEEAGARDPSTLNLWLSLAKVG